MPVPRVKLPCMNRLIGKDMDEGFRGYCENRIKELEQRVRQSAATDRLEALRETLQRMPPRQHGADAASAAHRERPPDPPR